ESVGTLRIPLANAKRSAVATARVNVIFLTAFSLTITFFMAVSRRLRDMSFSIVRGAHARTCDTLHTNDPIVSFRTVHSPRGRRLRRVHSARKHAHATQIRRNKLEAGGPPAESNLSPADDQLR